MESCSNVLNDVNVPNHIDDLVNEYPCDLERCDAFFAESDPPLVHTTVASDEAVAVSVLNPVSRDPFSKEALTELSFSPGTYISYGTIHNEPSSATAHTQTGQLSAEQPAELQASASPVDPCCAPNVHPSLISSTSSSPTQEWDGKPVFKQIDPSGDNVQIHTNYVLPSEGGVSAFPVVEIYQAECQTAKVNINYGTHFLCDICQRQFGNQGSLLQHRRQKHEGPRQFRCETCGKTYLTEPDLQQHKESHDQTKKQWKCTKCDKRYMHKKDRDRHYDSHHGTPKHPCTVEGCVKAFARRDHMVAHVDSHRNRNKREMKKAQEREQKEQGKVGEEREEA